MFELHAARELNICPQAPAQTQACLFVKRSQLIFQKSEEFDIIDIDFE